jgi:ABC-2 type transport system permease protein
MAAPLVLLPAALALFWRTVAPRDRFVPEVAYNTLSGTLVFGFILVILAVLFSTGVVSQELEGRTIVYLLTRPVPRARILLAKFLGAFTGITLTIWLATLLLALTAYGVGGFGQAMVKRDLAILPLGALAYGSLFLLTATALNRPLIYGLFFAFGWESWIPILPGTFQRISVMTYLRVLAPHTQPEEAPSGLSRLMALLTPQKIAVPAAWWALGGTAVVALLLALLVFSRKEYAPREDTD